MIKFVFYYNVCSSLKVSLKIVLIFIFLALQFWKCFAQLPYIKSKDTTKIPTVKDTMILPGPIDTKFLPEQDSAYFRAKRLSIPPSARFYSDMKLLEQEIALQKKLFGLTESEIAKKNLQIPREFYLPTGQEITLYQYGLMQSQYVPFLQIYKPYGVKIPLSSIGSLFGLSEDVSPLLEYNLEYVTDVQVSIYNEKGLLVATIVNTIQSPGRYRYYWSGRDDSGRLLPRGDYIGEIRIGKTRFIRKRIRLDYQ